MYQPFSTMNSFHELFHIRQCLDQAWGRGNAKALEYQTLLPTYSERNLDPLLSDVWDMHIDHVNQCLLCTTRDGLLAALEADTGAILWSMPLYTDSPYNIPSLIPFFDVSDGWMVLEKRGLYIGQLT